MQWLLEPQQLDLCRLQPQDPCLRTHASSMLQVFATAVPSWHPPSLAHCAPSGPTREAVARLFYCPISLPLSPS